METLEVEGVTFRLAGISPESLGYLQKKLERFRRRERRGRQPLGWLWGRLLPRDYRPEPLEALARGRVLVIGCGGGVETLGLGAIGIDTDQGALGIANDLRLHGDRPGAVFLAASGTDLPFRDGSFDSVLSDNVIEHFPPHLIPRHLRETRRVLGPQGIYVFSSPNRLFEQPLRPGHVSVHSYQEWDDLVREAGFGDARTPRRRSGRLVPLDWKKARERSRGGIGSLLLSRRGIRTVTIVARR